MDAIQIMEQSIGEFKYLLPEFSLVLGIVSLSILSAFEKKLKSKKALYGVSLVSLLLAIVFSFDALSFAKQSIFSGLILNGKFSFFSQIMILGTAVFVLLSNIGFKNSEESQKGEYFLLILGIVLGASLSVRSENLLFIFLSFELISICSYALTILNKKRVNAEASLKYLIFGVIVSGIALYGFSFLYGFTGNLNFSSPDFIQVFSIEITWTKALIVLLSSCFFLFKISVIPFHFWAPDVYEKAPTPIVSLFSTIPKIAGFIVLFRFVHHLDVIFNDVKLIYPLIAVALISISFANLMALAQENAKRLMAYSSISQSGLILLLIILAKDKGFESFVYYLCAYIFMNLSYFYLLILVEKKNDLSDFSELNGVGHKYPFLAFLAIITSLALTGLPPTVGFSAKLWLFTDIWEVYSQEGNALFLTALIIAILNTVIALFYYLKLPYHLVFRTQKPYSLEIKALQKTLAFALCFPLLLMFFYSEELSGLIKIINDFF